MRLDCPWVSLVYKELSILKRCDISWQMLYLSLKCSILILAVEYNIDRGYRPKFIIILEHKLHKPSKIILFSFSLHCHLTLSHLLFLFLLTQCLILSYTCCRVFPVPTHHTFLQVFVFRIIYLCTSKIIDNLLRDLVIYPSNHIVNTSEKEKVFLSLYEFCLLYIPYGQLPDDVRLIWCLERSDCYYVLGELFAAKNTWPLFQHEVSVSLLLFSHLIHLQNLEFL